MNFALQSSQPVATPGGGLLRCLRHYAPTAGYGLKKVTRIISTLNSYT